MRSLWKWGERVVAVIAVLAMVGTIAILDRNQPLTETPPH